MCGIVGYTGLKNATDILLDGLKNLEYRGYDSTGISVFENGNLVTHKTKGRLQNLEDRFQNGHKPRGFCGIGHTRWATHGKPSGRNAHPHFTNKLALVHNGIIENYLQLKAFLCEQGYTFTSDTDTEVLSKLLDYHYKGNPFTAISKTLPLLEGSFALGILFSDYPDQIWAVRKDSPLIVGAGKGENFIASDIPAILSYTRDYYLLDEMEIAEICPEAVHIFGLDGKIKNKEIQTANWDINQAQKSGYPHFMLKEINEQPKALMDTIHPRIHDGLPDFSADNLPNDFFKRFKKIHIVACGTAMHAGIVGKNLIEELARIPVEVDIASEFRYRNPILHSDCLVVVVSQSGETADSLAALRLAKSVGIQTLAIVNVAGSSIAREADFVLHTYAGPEIAVASTKAFAVQIGLFYLLAIQFAYVNGCLQEEPSRILVREVLHAVEETKHALAYSQYCKEIAPRFINTPSLFYLGRGMDYSLAMEGSLKLKEISYIHSESYAAGELKHGTISLITNGVPVVALVTQRELLPKMTSNIKEVRSRGGMVLIITKEDFEIDTDIYDFIIKLPSVSDFCSPILSVIILQLFAYHIAVERGCDVDKPRNLAKSVTVE